MSIGHAGYSRKLLGARGQRGPTAQLSPRMITALQFAADGYTAQAASVACGISVFTVKSQRKAAMHRLGADSMPQAVAMGFRRGILK
jgi:DNA-binding CsgD family transcriptional regulator